MSNDMFESYVKPVTRRMAKNMASPNAPEDANDSFESHLSEGELIPKKDIEDEDEEEDFLKGDELEGDYRSGYEDEEKQTKIRSRKQRLHHAKQHKNYTSPKNSTTHLSNHSTSILTQNDFETSKRPKRSSRARPNYEDCNSDTDDELGSIPKIQESNANLPSPPLSKSLLVNSTRRNPKRNATSRFSTQDFDDLTINEISETVPTLEKRQLRSARSRSVTHQRPQLRHKGRIEENEMEYNQHGLEKNNKRTSAVISRIKRERQKEEEDLNNMRRSKRQRVPKKDPNFAYDYIEEFSTPSTSSRPRTRRSSRQLNIINDDDASVIPSPTKPLLSSRSKRDRHRLTNEDQYHPNNGASANQIEEPLYILNSSTLEEKLRIREQQMQSKDKELKDQNNVQSEQQQEQQQEQKEQQEQEQQQQKEQQDLGEENQLEVEEQSEDIEKTIEKRSENETSLESEKEIEKKNDHNDSDNSDYEVDEDMEVEEDDDEEEIDVNVSRRNLRSAMRGKKGRRSGRGGFKASRRRRSTRRSNRQTKSGEDEEYIAEDDDDITSDDAEVEELPDEAITDDTDSGYNLRRRNNRAGNASNGENKDNEQDKSRTYSLRPRDKIDKPMYTMPVPPTPGASTPNRYAQISDKYAKYISLHRRLVQESSSSSSSSDDDDDDRYVGIAGSSRKRDEYAHLAPINMSSPKSKKNSPSADITPMIIDKGVDWKSIGGLHNHVKALKEMVVLPLLYPEVFQRFCVTPPRGVIFHGAPGTGKTLVARALANSCRIGGQKISFFMRKGADILSKWVGEAEKQLRLLFDQAKKLQPSIIFFDEIDGLAPVRSSKQDYIHSSIVSTLLALLDGLDNRGQVIVIGATNRVDAIDPALRRPGRFDRELYFPLPSRKARKEIFNIHTASWNPSIPNDIKNDICRRCVGYCGADIKALCTEAALRAFRRQYPQVYDSKDRLVIDINKVSVTKEDFLLAMSNITPASHRGALIHSRALAHHLAPCLSSTLDHIKNIVREVFPISHKFFEEDNEDDDGDEKSHNNAENEIISFSKMNRSTVDKADDMFSDFFLQPPIFRPWLLIHGKEGMGQVHLARALLHSMEEIPLFSVGIHDLYATVYHRIPEEALIHTFAEARKNSPSIIWIPSIDKWWSEAGDMLRSSLVSLLKDFPSSLQIFVLATCTDISKLSQEICHLFSEHRFEVPMITTEQRRAMFQVILKDIKRAPPSKFKYSPKPLPIAPPIKVPEIDLDQEDKELRKEEEKFLRDLRINLREVVFKILSGQKRFETFVKPTQNRPPSDKKLVYIFDVLEKVEKCEYITLREFLDDFQFMVDNVHLYDIAKGDYAAIKLHSKATQLLDVAKTYSTTIPDELIRKCKKISIRRSKFAKRKTDLNKSQEQQSSQCASNDNTLETTVTTIESPSSPSTLPTTTIATTTTTTTTTTSIETMGTTSEKTAETTASTISITTATTENNNQNVISLEMHKSPQSTENQQNGLQSSKNGMESSASGVSQEETENSKLDGVASENNNNFINKSSNEINPKNDAMDIENDAQTNGQIIEVDNEARSQNNVAKSDTSEAGDKTTAGNIEENTNGTEKDDQKDDNENRIGDDLQNKAAPLDKEPKEQEDPKQKQDSDAMDERDETDESQTVIPLEIDEQRLNTWFERLIENTDGFTVEQLDHIFSKIYTQIFHFRNNTNRNDLLSKLENLTNHS